MATTRDTGEWTPLVQFESIQTPGVLYLVSRDRRTGELGCNCPGWRFRKTCRHVTLVTELGGSRPGISDEDIRKAFEMVEMRIKVFRDALAGMGNISADTSSKVLAKLIARLDEAGFTKPMRLQTVGAGGINPRRQRLITIEE